MTADVRDILSRHPIVFEKPPEHTPADHSVDGPLLGNGDLGVAISGPPAVQRYHIAKNDFWKLRKGRRFGGGAAPIGVFTLQFRTLFRVGEYRIEQDMYDATARSTFGSAASSIGISSWVAATANILFIEVECVGGSAVVEPELTIYGGRGSEAAVHVGGDALWGSRSFSALCDIETGAACCAVIAAGKGDIGSVSLREGERVVFAVTVVSSFDDPDYVLAARERGESLRGGGETVESLRLAHAGWWDRFWHESWVEIDDSAIEAQYYRSQYILASSSRNPEFPPPIFGTWITTDDPMWMGDYHLNYNHMAPYYGLYSSNHLEQAAPYEAPVLAFADRGRFYAKSLLGIRGIFFPVGIGPKGVETTWDPAPFGQYPPHYEGEGLFYGQKSNAAYAVVNMAMRWRATYDLSYARKVYPFIVEVAEFWEDYVRLDGDRYVIDSDSIHEGSGPDFNPILSLGLVRCVMETAVDMSVELGIDDDRRPRWRDIHDRLSGFPVYERGGKTVFRLCERGVGWFDSNTLGIQHIYPSGAVGPDGDPRLLRISRDTIDVLDRWFDTNGMNSLYPAAVRVGYDPEVILAKLHEHCTGNIHPNGFTVKNPHGIETCSTVPNTINEMLCMSHGGKLRLFYGWPRGRDAGFRSLRAVGAFLVSAEIEGGKVGTVTIESERGRMCVIENPWPGSEAMVERSGGSPEVYGGPEFSFPTREGETFTVYERR